MIQSIKIDTLVNRIAELMPKDGGQVAGDLRRNLRSLITGMLARMDLVTREELDVQTAVLQRTRARIEVLEKQLAELETQMKQKGTTAS